MKPILTCIIFFCLILNSNAQVVNQPNSGGNEITLLTKEYSRDPSAEAVIISNEGKSSFSLTEQSGFQVIYEWNTRIKIFSKAGIKWSEIAIPFYKESGLSEDVYEISASTFNMVNGKEVKTELISRNIFTEKTGDNWYVKKFALPDVKEGSIIYYTYKIKSPFLFSFRSWEFQNRIPVVFSRYTTRMIPFYEYRYILQGTNKLDDFNSYEDKYSTGYLNSIQYHDMVYEFVMRDLPAFKDESYITSIEDYIIKLNFQLALIRYPDGRIKEIMSTWPKLSEELLDHDDFGKYLKSCSRKCKEAIEGLKLDTKSPLEKAQAIDRYMKSNFNWNGDNDKFSSKNVKEFMTGKAGNTADINLFLIGMLNSAGIEASPVILSTRSHGKINGDYPFQRFFNYVVALANIDGKNYLMDATEPFCVFGEIPSRCLNDRGLIIQKNKVEWVSLKFPSSSVTEYQFNWTFNSSLDSIAGKCKLAATGYKAVSYRNEYVDSFKDLKAELIGSNSSQMDSITSTNLKETDKPFEINYGIKNQVEKIEDKLAISVFPNVVMTENPLKQPARSYPVDMIYKKAYKYQSVIKIPQGYKLMKKPDDLAINNDLVSIVYASEVNQGEVKVIGYYEFKKEEYNSANYNDIKGYFNKIIDKFNEKLVLVKL